ncbi:MAG: DUF2258 domain-containing protein [Thermoprotei archaeon]|nr:MAG: DUF2258 domain-containing protein [Thermoprotei archaeon]
MPRLSTGYIIAGAYANKVRRVLFALTKPLKVPSDAVVEASKNLNMKLLRILQECGIDKGDVVRIIIDFDIEDGEITWKWDTLSIEYFKRVDLGDKPKKILESLLKEEASPQEGESREV